MKGFLNVFRAVIADNLLMIALRLYPEGFDKASLAVHLSIHFKTILLKEDDREGA